MQISELLLLKEVRLRAQKLGQLVQFQDRKAILFKLGGAVTVLGQEGKASV